MASTMWMLEEVHYMIAGDQATVKTPHGAARRSIDLIMTLVDIFRNEDAVRVGVLHSRTHDQDTSLKA